MRPARTWTARPLWGQRGEGAAINTAINRRHKSLALLPVPCVSISLSPRYRPQAWIWEPNRAEPSHDERERQREQERLQRDDVGKARGEGGRRRKGERDTHPRCRVERRPMHGRVSIRGCHGGGCSITLLLPRTQTRRAVCIEESARSGPLILLEDRMRPDPDPSLHSNSWRSSARHGHLVADCQNRRDLS